MGQVCVSFLYQSKPDIYSFLFNYCAPFAARVASALPGDILTTAILATDYGYGFTSTLLFSILTAVIFSFLIGGISLRLTDDYFAIGTLAFSFVTSALLINWKNGIIRRDYV